MQVTALVVALALVIGCGCGTTLGQQAEASGIVLGTCVATCAANCVPELLVNGRADPLRAQRYGVCLAACSAQCLPLALRAFHPVEEPAE